MNPAAQTSLDFTQTRHNNRESESFYEENMDKFSEQCKKVLKLLREGDRLTVYDAVLLHGISSLPRRIADLREGGIAVNDSWVRDENGKRLHKEYFINP